MAVKNSLTQQEEEKKPKFSVAINQKTYQYLIHSALGDPKRAARFISAISSAVSTNPDLQECDAGTIISAGLLGESLNLSPSPQLGQYYLVPFEDRKNKRKNAQFILGYKGYIQLATRSGQYRKLTVLPIKAGELIGFDPMNEEIAVELIQDEQMREETETIGYYAMFEYINGFRKAIYWSKEKMLIHADRYSPAFSKDGCKIKTRYGEKQKVSYADYAAGNYNKDDEWMYSSFWYKQFDDMACKTMLRQLLSKWGIMSIDLQTAYESDMSVLHTDGTKEFPVNEPDIIQSEPDMPPVSAPVDIIDDVSETSDNDVANALFGGMDE